MSESLVRALDRRLLAERDVMEILRRDYPVGHRVAWERSGVHEGIVVSHGYDDRIKVRNTRTRKEFWIYAFHIVNAMASRPIP